jgi:hypothetical protein
VSEADEFTGGGAKRLSRRVKPILAAAGALALVIGLSCPSQTGTPASRPPAHDTELTIFFTGSELGELKPCGCSGGQLGGLEKRAGLFDAVPASNRLVVETGALVAGDGEQDLIKFGILFEGLSRLSYDVVYLTDSDLEIAGRLGLLTDTPRGFRVISSTGEGRSRVFTRRFTCRGREVLVRVAAFDPAGPGAEETAGLLKEVSGVPTVDILILQQEDSALLRALAAQMPAVACIICPCDSDEPRQLSEPGVRPLVFSVGRFGRYVCRLGVTVSGPDGKPALRFERVPVEAKLPDDEALVQLYRQYQRLVTDARLLEKYPRVPLPDGLAYAGSGRCKRCHEYEYDKWSVNPHARAFASLQKVGSDHDPECVVCHVVGMEYESGFVTGEKTPTLTDVGCENCHGPGSRHTSASGQTALGQPKTHCRSCHAPERSAGYAGHEEEYMQKIVHWREPAATGNVKQ